MPLAPALLASRYRLLEALGEGGMGIVYRAEDRLSQRDVALKRVLTDAPLALNRAGGVDGRPVMPLTLVGIGINDTTDAGALALAHEFRFLASLRHPNIISVLDFGFDEEDRPYFTMDWLPGARDLFEASRARDTAGTVDLIVQVLRALVYLHRRGIVHRDLKPSNILVTPEGEVKVLDFGISVQSDTAPAGAGITGTAAYLAPEILAGEAATAAADLYAVGTLAYEMLAGRHPFDTRSVSRLLAQVALAEPDMAPMHAAPLGAVLAPVVEQLLRKAPENRYPSAAAALTAIAEAIGRPDVAETDVTRESLLKSARFVGRAEELDQLTTAWREVQRGNQLRFLLIGGESGVGKSRLLDELRVYALVTGALVMHGQAVNQAGASYQLWRETARYVALRSDLTPLDQSVLKSIVPDLERIVGHAVQPAPELEPQATQERLQRLLVRTLKRFTQPTLFVLEDLQWASAVSLTLLQRLTEELRGQPFMFVANYRSEEAPRLRDMFVEASHISLERLSRTHIAALTHSMLGDIASDRATTMVDLLHAETAGNAFFVVEALRSLAEHAGGLERVSRLAVTREMVKGSLTHIVGDRLKGIPATLNRLLQYAAVYGRDLDIAVLRALAEREGDLDRLLSSATESNLFAVSENTYRFAHDKLREGVLETIAKRQLAQMHARIAETIEATHTDSLPEYAIALAYHWREAGTNKPAESSYAAMAGRQLAERGSYKEAVLQYKHALDLANTVQMSPFATAKLERALGEAYFSDGQTDRAAIHLRRCVALLGPPFPVTNAGLGLRLFGEIGKQMMHRLLPRRFFLRRGEEAERALEASLAYDTLSHIIYFDNKPIATQYSTLRNLNFAESAPPSVELAGAYGSICCAMGLLRMYRAGHFYDRKSVEVAAGLEQAGHQIDPWTWEVTGHYYAQKGDFVTAMERTEKAARSSLEIGFVSRWLECILQFESIHYRLGQFEKATEYRDIAHEQAVKLQHGRNRARVWLTMAQFAMLQGDLPKAADLLERAKGLSHRLGFNERTWMQGLAAGFHLLRNDLEAVKAASAEGLTMLKGQPLPVLYYTQDGYTALAEACLVLAEQPNLSAEERRELKSRTKLAMQRLRGFGQSFPVSRAHVQRIEGWHAWQSGKHAAAQAHWDNAVREADRYGQVFEKALVQYDLGRFLPDGRGHLSEALEIFESLGFEPYRRRTEELLKR